MVVSLIKWSRVLEIPSIESAPTTIPWLIMKIISALGQASSSFAMASAKSSDPQVYKDHIMKVANGTGEKIYPGELAKGIKLASYGVAIDYVGASSVSLIGPGEAAGNFREIQIQNGKMVDVNYR